MTHEDISRMAQEAGLSAEVVYDIRRMAREAGLSHAAAHYHEYDQPRIRLDGLHWNGELERFAALVAAAEREACAKLVEPSDEHRRDASWGYMGGNEGVELLDEIAAAIRARGEK